MGFWRNLGKTVSQAKRPVPTPKNDGPRPEGWTQPDEDYYNQYVKKNARDSPVERTSTKAGSTVSRWGDRVSESVNGAKAKISSPAFQNFAKNAVANSDNILGTGGFGGNMDLVGLGGTARSKSGSKQGSKQKSGLRPAFYDAMTGKTYIAKNGKKSGSKKSKRRKGPKGPREFNPW
jgi:hypothetical protein